MTSPIPATSPRKRALMPTGDLRRALRAHGHPLRPLVQIGKGGVTTGVLAQIASALFDHELIKVRIGTECPIDRFEVADALGAQPGTQVVQLVGRVALIYKRHPDKPRYEGQAARDRAAGIVEPAPAARPKSSRRSKEPRRSSKSPQRTRPPQGAKPPQRTRPSQGAKEPRRSGSSRQRSK